MGAPVISGGRQLRVFANSVTVIIGADRGRPHFYERIKLKKNNIENVQNVNNNPLVSEYKIGNTTYIVELHFNFDRGETLEDVIRRLMMKDAGIV